MTKKLKSLKGSKKQNDKKTAKIAAIEKELSCFKTLKSSDFKMEYALNKKLANVLTNPAATSEEKIISRVLISPMVQKTVDNLIEEFGQEFVKEAMKKVENVTPKTKKKVKKGQKTEVKSKKKDKATKKPAVANDEWIEEDLEVEEPTAKEPAKSKGSDTLPEQPNESPKQNGNSVKENGATKSKRRDRKRKQEEAAAQKTLDSFFVTSTGENYMASVAANISSDSESEVKEKVKPKKFEEKKKFNGKSDAQISKKRKETPATSHVEQSKEKITPKINAKEQSQFRKSVQNVEKSEDIEKLHPSWQAKMIQKVMTEFQGTKITFDDDD